MWMGWDRKAQDDSGWWCLLSVNWTHFLLPVVGFLMDGRYHSTPARFWAKNCLCRMVALRSFLLRWFRSRWLVYRADHHKGEVAGPLVCPNPNWDNLPWQSSELWSSITTVDTQFPARLMLFPSALPICYYPYYTSHKSNLTTINISDMCLWVDQPNWIKMPLAKLLGIPKKPLFNNKTVGPSHFLSRE